MLFVLLFFSNFFSPCFFSFFFFLFHYSCKVPNTLLQDHLIYDDLPLFGPDIEFHNRFRPARIGAIQLKRIKSVLVRLKMRQVETAFKTPNPKHFSPTFFKLFFFLFQLFVFSASLFTFLKKGCK